MTFPDSISLPYFFVKPAPTTPDMRHPLLYASTKSSNIFHHKSNTYLLQKVVRAKNYSSIVHLSLVAQMVKNLLAMRETQVQSLGWEDPLEKGLATHSSILAWRIPWTEEPGGVQSIGSRRVGHD